MIKETGKFMIKDLEEKKNPLKRKREDQDQDSALESSSDEDTNDTGLLKQKVKSLRSNKKQRLS